MEVVVEVTARLGECPLWSPDEQVLYWIDIDGRLLHRFDPATGDDEAQPVPGRPGSIALTDEAGRLVVAHEHEVGEVRWGDDGFTPWVAVERPGTGNRLNDGRADPDGRFWVGSMHERPAAGRRTGALHRVDPDGTVTTHRRDVGVSNSLAFAPDGTTMYWSDTPTGLVWTMSYDRTTGEPGRASVLVDFTDLPGLPDGACVDETGAVWVACVTGGALVRLSPSGAVDRLVEVPVSSPTMPAFGGADLATMYVTSIGDATSASVPGHRSLDGAVIAWDPGVRGLPEPAVRR